MTMAKWKFGDVIEEAPGVLIMVLSKNAGVAFLAGDEYEIDPGQWVGLVIVSDTPAAFPPGETSWIPPWDWKKVDR